MWDVRYKVKIGDKITFIPLKIHKCSDADYDAFFTPSKSFAKVFDQAKKRKNHYCLDEGQQLEVFGLSDNTDYQRLDILYVPCNPDLNKQCTHT